MQEYTQVYFDAFGVDYDVVSGDHNCKCECCGEKSTEIHHIISRKKFQELLKDICNLMSICRNCHEEYGDRNYLIPMLLKIHRKHMQIAGIKYDEGFFDFYIQRYGNV